MTRTTLPRKHQLVSVALAAAIFSSGIPRRATADCSFETEARAVQRASHVFVGKAFPVGPSVPIHRATFRVRIERVLWGDRLRPNQEVEIRYDVRHGSPSMPGRVIVFATWNATENRFEIPMCSLSSIVATTASIDAIARAGTRIGRRPGRAIGSAAPPTP